MEKRKYQRYDFTSGEGPVLKIGDKEFPIENMSQGGIKFVKNRDETFDDVINGIIVFPSGEKIEIDGSIKWELEDVIGLSFTDLIPEDLFGKDQHVAFLKTRITIPKLNKPENFVESPGYTMVDVIKTGVSVRRVEDWVHKGYILPSMEDPDNTEDGKMFSRFDLYLIKVFDHLTTRSFSEIEAAIRTRIMALAEKKPGRYLYKTSFVAFSRKVDFSMVPIDMKEKMLVWLTEKELLEEKERNDIKDFLKNFIPTLIQEKDGKLLLSSMIYENTDDILIINFKRVRDFVDDAISYKEP